MNTFAATTALIDPIASSVVIMKFTEIKIEIANCSYWCSEKAYPDATISKAFINEAKSID
jgi:hypothetical protein